MVDDVCRASKDCWVNGRLVTDVEISEDKPVEAVTSEGCWIGGKVVLGVEDVEELEGLEGGKDMPVRTVLI